MTPYRHVIDRKTFEVLYCRGRVSHLNNKIQQVACEVRGKIWRLEERTGEELLSRRHITHERIVQVVTVPRCRCRVLHDVDRLVGRPDCDAIRKNRTGCCLVQITEAAGIEQATILTQKGLLILVIILELPACTVFGRDHAEKVASSGTRELS